LHISQLPKHPAESLHVKKTVKTGGVNQIYCKKKETLAFCQNPFFFVNSLSAVSLIMAA